MQQFEDNLCRRASGRCAVGFDVFGTLLLRDVARPTDLFSWMEEFGSAPAGFAKARVAAEQEARAAKQGEVTLAEIYAQTPLAGMDPQAECRAEQQWVIANPQLFGAVRRLHEQGKKVYAISDMYLPRQQVEAMLRGCGYDFLDGVFVSSEYGVQKRSGKLFQVFLKQTGLKPHQVLFVGDDRRADLVGAALAGIPGLLLPAGRGAAYAVPARDWHQGADQAFLANRLPEIPPEQRIGFETVGPIAAAFAEFLNRRRQEHPVATLVFLARDMHLVRRIYCSNYPEDRQVAYLKVSRRSLCPALLQCPMNEENLSLFADALPRQRLTVEQILQYCGFEPGVKLNDFTPETMVDLRERPLSQQTQRILLTVVACGKTAAGDSVRRKAALVRRYLQEQLGQDTILVDIGSGGTTQRVLEALQGRQMQGLYLACDERLYEHLPRERAEAFLFGGGPAPLWYWAGQPLLERLLSEPCGATVGYRAEGQTVVPLLEEQAAESCIDAAQKGAILYNTMRRASPLEKQEIAQPQSAFLEMIRAPRPAEAEILGDLMVEDGGIYPLADPRGWGHYFSHPKHLMADFAQARWKTAFLRRLLRLPLPYDALYAAMKKKRRV